MSRLICKKDILLFLFSHKKNIFWIFVRGNSNKYSKYMLLEVLTFIFSRRQTDDIFLIFPRKQDLTFHLNCLLLYVKSCFLGKIRKIK